MDISTIQKRKFLNNLDRLYLSSGKKPNPQEIRKIFNSYFSINKLGQPVDIDYSLIRGSSVVDVDMLNEMMAKTLLNIEVLYDCNHQSNTELFEVITILNKKIDSLKRRRAKLEDRVDQILFENSNSDGYFYSFTENFSDINMIDLDISSAHVDTANRRAEIPFITSQYSKAITSDRYIPTSVTYSVKVNGSDIVSNAQAKDYDNMFDGLNDTYWSHDPVTTSRQSVVSLTMTIPIDTGLEISKIDGKLLSSSPSSVYVRCVSSDPSVEDLVMSNSSNQDYDNFSFRFASARYNAVVITIIKVEPDEISLSNIDPYLYRFGVRELMIGAKYYDTKAELVSRPISVSSGEGELLSISSLAIEVGDSVPRGTEIRYYVAPDVPDALGSISDFDWTEIEPVNYAQGSNPKFVSLTSSRSRRLTIGSSDADLLIMPLVTDSSGASSSQINPFIFPYSSVPVYRVANISDYSEKIIKPYILSGVRSIKHYGIVHDQSVSSQTLYKDPEYWAYSINNSAQGLYNTTLTDQLINISTPFQNPSSGYYKINLLCDQSFNTIQTLTKSDYDFNLSVYLNGSMIADLASGSPAASIEWSFSKGLNAVEIYYDKPSSIVSSFNIMSGSSLEEYGSVFLSYYNYVDPVEFRRRASSGSNLFTIETIQNSRQIISNRYIDSNSEIRYTSDPDETVTAVRYRASMHRYSNPLTTPSLDSIRVRFRNS